MFKYPDSFLFIVVTCFGHILQWVKYHESRKVSSMWQCVFLQSPFNDNSSLLEAAWALKIRFSIELQAVLVIRRFFTIPESWTKWQNHYPLVFPWQSMDLGLFKDQNRCYLLSVIFVQDIFWTKFPKITRETCNVVIS
jgi:hypothetical protein